MDRRGVIAFVLAGGQGSRLYPLTAEQPKPVLPFVGGYRIIDFVLSNLINSGVRIIYVLVQYKPAPLLAHLNAVWGADTPGGPVRVLQPVAGGDRFRGTADAVRKCIHVLDRHQPDLVAVLAADHIYRMDLNQMLAFHRHSRADVSLAALPVPVAQADRFGITAADGAQRVSEFQEKPHQPRVIPDRPDYAYASLGNYLFDARLLVDALGSGPGQAATDFGGHLLPQLVGKYRVYAYDFATNRIPGIRCYEEPAYWRDVGTITALEAARRDSRGGRPRFDLANRYWPIRRAGTIQDQVPVHARSEPLMHAGRSHQWHSPRTFVALS